MNNAVLSRKSSAPGGPITEISSQNSKSKNPQSSSMSRTGPRADTPPFKVQSSANLSREQLISKNSSEHPQGVDPSKREVGNENVP